MVARADHVQGTLVLSAAAEALHRDFLRRLLGVRKSTANHMVLAELGRFPLQIHFWQQILRYHHRTIALDNVRLQNTLAKLPQVVVVGSQVRVYANSREHRK